MIVLEFPTYSCSKCGFPFEQQIEAKAPGQTNLSEDVVVFKHMRKDIIDIDCPDIDIEFEIPLKSFLRSIQ